METHHLGSVQINLLRADTIELIFDEGIEVNSLMIDAVLAFIDAHVATPALILFNKLNRYSYEFGTQLRIAALNNVKGVAIVNYTTIGKMVTATILATFFSKPRWPIQTFANRNEALAWLYALAPQPGVLLSTPAPAQASADS